MDVKKRKRRASNHVGHNFNSKKRRSAGKNRGGISYYIPHDIVEIILSRLPVKSLLRLKGVCKQWSATISDDPKFAENHHLQRSNTSSCSYLELIERPDFRFRRIRIENNKFQKLSIVENPLQGYSGCGRLLGHCDGIFLFSCKGSNKDYLVWNPSTKTYKQVHYPHPIYIRIISGICYDPLMKDYKVVIGDVYSKHYAVYYCKTNSWSELKKMNINVKINNYFHSNGINFKGFIYWISRLKKGPRFELVCFDGRAEKFKNYGSVDCISNRALLISSRVCLYVFPIETTCQRKKSITIYKKVGDDDPWMELVLELPFTCEYVLPLCWTTTRENQIMLKSSNRKGKWKYFLYGDTNRSYATQQIQSDIYFDLFPELENLLLL